jgi:hypothetical protein
MDDFISEIAIGDTPQLNPLIANGLAVAHMELSESYINSVWRAVAKGFPPELKYVRCERCDAQEEFNEETRKRSNVRVFDMARTDFYMMKYIFDFKGEEIVRYIKLPFVGEAGILHISGSRFVISPILADRVLSPGLDSVFVRLIRARITIERLDHQLIVDDCIDSVKVPWSLVYNKNPQKLEIKPAVKCNTTLAHYLFCKFGFSEAFLRTAGAVPIVEMVDTVSREKYPKEDWVICSSRPKLLNNKFSFPSKVALVIPRDKFTLTMKSMVGGFFYIAEHFSHEMDVNEIDTPRMWRTFLGRILYSGNVNIGKIHDDVCVHIGSLDEYVDEVMKKKFKEINLPVNDLYEFFMIVIERINDWCNSSKDKINSLYDKELSILYYVFVELMNQINNFYFRLGTLVRSGKTITRKEIEQLMTTYIKMGAVFAIREGHGEVSTTTTSGDNKAFKMTALMVPQANSSSTGGKNDTAALSDPSKRLHSSIAEVGGYLNIPKSEPSGHSRINRHLRVAPSGLVQKNPEFIDLLLEVEEVIRRI